MCKFDIPNVHKQLRLQIENWIDVIGEAFLGEHIDTGSSLQDSEKISTQFNSFLDEVRILLNIYNQLQSFMSFD